jgi:hypothetical protein
MSKSHKSKDLRCDKLFLRNEFDGEKTWGIPVIRPIILTEKMIQLISYTDTKLKDRKNCHKYVHCFQDDSKLLQAYSNPENRLLHLARYKGVLTPDYSLYPEMPRWRQLESIAHSRWCGACWQTYGLIVIPTINWSDENSFDFCFLGLEKGGTVAVSTLSCLCEPTSFLRGYRQMLNILEPSAIICYGDIISGMCGNIIQVDYLETTRRGKQWADEEVHLAGTLAS